MPRRGTSCQHDNLNMEGLVKNNPRHSYILNFPKAGMQERSVPIRKTKYWQGSVHPEAELTEGRMICTIIRYNCIPAFLSLSVPEYIEALRRTPQISHADKLSSLSYVQTEQCQILQLIVSFFDWGNFPVTEINIRGQGVDIMGNIFYQIHVPKSFIF